MKSKETTLYNIPTALNGIRYSLFDLATWKNGLAFKKIDFSESGLPIIKIAELNNGIGANTSYTNGDYGKDVYLQKDDLLFSWSGNPMTSIDVFRCQFTAGWLNQHIFKVTADESKVTKNFLYYLLKYLKPNFTQIALNKQTTGLGHVTIADLKKINVFIPNKDIQKKIALVLRRIDEKIAVNTQINENLEQQAQALFKAWFVDFEPFGGVMPDDWQITPLGELCDSISKKHKFNKPELIFLNTGDVENGKFLHNNYSDISEMPGQAKKTIAKNDILYSEIRPINKHFAYVNFVAEDYVVSTKLMVLRAKGINPRRLYQFLTMPDTLNELQLEAETRSGTFPQIRFDNIQQLEMIVASKQLEEEYSTIINTIYAAIDNNIAENQRLSVLRNTLLPKLMNGEIDVSKVKI